MLLENIQSALADIVQSQLKTRGLTRSQSLLDSQYPCTPCGWEINDFNVIKNSALDLDVSLPTVIETLSTITHVILLAVFNSLLFSLLKN